MKKIAILLVMISIFCVTGCGQDNLVCKMTNDANTELTINQSIIVGFENEVVSNLDIRIILDLKNKEALKKIDQLEKELKESYKEFDGKTGVNIKSSSKDKRVTLLLKAELNKMDENVKTTFVNAIGIDGTKEDVKKGLESQGYTCK